MVAQRGQGLVAFFQVAFDDGQAAHFNAFFRQLTHPRTAGNTYPEKLGAGCRIG